MKTTFLTLITLLFIAIVISRLAKYVAKKVMQDYDKQIEESEQFSYFPPSKETSEEIKLETKEEVTETSSRVVISVTNDSSSSKNKTRMNEKIEFTRADVEYNDIQNLSSVNKNVYRAKNGRFKSTK
jgi:hypothetical protein